jgi:superfamily I DNA/RNA helicase
MITSPTDWQPQGISSLEPAAFDAVREVGKSCLVIAGPGAGKTELLAQKACYLLQTSLCPSPKRILAISFKRDAAKNLKERVELRCGKELSDRFDSFTFDAFAKGLVDRFSPALPACWSFSQPYDITFDLQCSNDVRSFLTSLIGKHGVTQRDISQVSHYTFLADHFCNSDLNPLGAFPATVGGTVARAGWLELLKNNNPPQLTFGMINRLAELIIRSNPLLCQALKSTYSHVFLDEFQDTTGMQYSLLMSCFSKSSAVMTAVGDGKQRIMSWAGALTNIFDQYKSDYTALDIRLLRNYRSAPNLVTMQHAIVEVLEGQGTPEAVSMDETGDGEGKVLFFSSDQLEAEHLAALIEAYMETENLSPGDICVLTRQTPDRYAALLIGILKEKGIDARVESQLQDLLAEPLTQLLIDTLLIIFSLTAPESWERVQDVLLGIRGADTETLAKRVDSELSSFMKECRCSANQNARTKEEIEALLKCIIGFFEHSALVALYPQYGQRKYFDDTVQSVAEHLAKYRSEYDWVDAVERLEGKYSVPVMTMHKSKGLEFHTVIFMGLEDNALWGYSKNPDEETCGFYVAFSRAKKRIIFSAAKERTDVDGNALVQSTKSIRPLYILLKDAGVPFEKVPRSVL